MHSQQAPRRHGRQDEEFSGQCASDTSSPDSTNASTVTTTTCPTCPGPTADSRCAHPQDSQLPTTEIHQSDKMRTFLAQCEVTSLPHPQPINRLYFQMDLESTLKTLFRGKLPINIHQLRQGNTTVRTYMEEFKFLTDLHWNEPALISQFRSGLNQIRQGIPHTLQDIYLASITAESQLAEIWAFFSRYKPPPQLRPVTTLNLPTTLDLDSEELMQIGAARQAPTAGEWQ
ncbi:PEG10: Retrotransposon-derived protein PEG10 [Crotalus adamanteus]|uniref:PEG10: Retrotransposon-derived protein PEG10 n=1 Tax=Crotalus adamanteus TaxID=8729 RepID=A0AAW1B0Q0_CROAD